MKEQENQIFREKSMEQLSAPEQLMDYLRVTGPGIWLILTGIIVLMAGILIWGVVGSVSSTIDVPAQAKDGVLHCYVLQEDMQEADDIVDIWIGDLEMEASMKEAKTITLDADDAPQLYETGYLTAGKNALELTCDTRLKDGFYQAELTTQTMKPIKLLFAKNG